MKHKLTIVNFVLVATILLVSAAIFKIWFGPGGSSKTDGKTLIASAQKFQGPGSVRSNYPPSIADEVVKKNLFRKDRIEFV
ncbi:MAG: hypothetical protein HY579_00845, partial [Nitrospinae bacterium]|nr:hypothetical protein [Nitrospinota bacterium]